jgi:hypothetical protein
MVRSRPNILKALFGASSATRPANLSAGAGDGEDADGGAGKLVSESGRFAVRFKTGGGEASLLSCWSPGNAMVDSIYFGLLETAIVYRGNSVSQLSST